MRKSELVAAILSKAGDAKRTIIAIAGPPGSGKSTLATQLHDGLMQAGALVTIVPMDGFHLDNSVLDELGLRNRKGAPNTFDAEGFVKLVEKLRDGKEPVAVPAFDRSLDKVVDLGRVVKPEQRIILVEGNYLLLGSKPWNKLHALFDMSVFLNPGIEVLQERLIKRWLDNDHTYDQALERANSNDIPNAITVIENSIAADFIATELT